MNIWILFHAWGAGIEFQQRNGRCQCQGFAIDGQTYFTFQLLKQFKNSQRQIRLFWTTWSFSQTAWKASNEMFRFVVVVYSSSSFYQTYVFSEYETMKLLWIRWADVIPSICYLAVIALVYCILPDVFPTCRTSKWLSFPIVCQAVVVRWTVQYMFTIHSLYTMIYT